MFNSGGVVHGSQRWSYVHVCIYGDDDDDGDDDDVDDGEARVRLSPFRRTSIVEKDLMIGCSFDRSM